MSAKQLNGVLCASMNCAVDWRENPVIIHQSSWMMSWDFDALLLVYHLRPNFSCPVCSRHYYRSNKYKQHLTERHSAEGKEGLESCRFLYYYDSSYCLRSFAKGKFQVKFLASVAFIKPRNSS